MISILLGVFSKKEEKKFYIEEKKANIVISLSG
jgi:hypothetical protein